MSDKNELLRVFTGSELTVNLLQEELNAEGIASYVQNDFNSGISAGFAAGSPTEIDLYIRENELQRAADLISSFVKRNETELDQSDD